MDLLNKVIGGGSLATAVASTMLPSGPMGMMGAGMAPMADVTGALAKIQALSGNVPSGNEKAMRELYVGGLPQGVGLNANQIRDFFNLVMTQSGLIRSPGQPVIQARIHETGAFAFVQFRSQEETDLALSLNGIPFMGSPLKIGRPKGYQTAVAAPAMNPAFSNVIPGGMSINLPSVAGALGLASSAAETPSDVILVANISSALTVESLKEIMGPFGVLADCILLPSDAGAAVQRALVRYEDVGLTDVVVKGLNNLPVGDLAMSLCRAPISLVAAHLPHLVPAHAAAIGLASASKATDVLELTNVVVGGELKSPSDVTDLQEDVAEECSKYGRVLEVVVPFSSLSAPEGQERVPLYVHLTSIAEAEKCAAALRGRKFDGRLVGINFVSVDVLQASKSAPSIPPGGNIEDEEDMGLEGGVGNHFSSVAIPPPTTYVGHENTYSGAPEDGLALPPVPAGADVD
jgi:splicing factor U2AF subunit